MRKHFTIIVLAFLLAGSLFAGVMPTQFVVTFDKAGQFSDNHSFVAQDAANLGRRFCIYVIPMQKGETYTIEIKSPNFDTLLHLHDPQDRQVAKTDGIGNAKLVHKADQTGSYRLHAMTGKQDTFGKFTITIHRESLEVVKKEPPKNRDSLVVGTLKIGDTVLRNLEMPAGEPIFGLGVWDPNGKYLYRRGVNSNAIYRIRFDEATRDFIKDGETVLAEKTGTLSMSAEGIVLSMSGFAQQLWVLDPQTLQVKKKIPTRTFASMPQTLATHPKLSIAALAGQQYFMLFDLKKGEVLSENIVKEKDAPIALFKLRAPLITADGKQLFTAGSDLSYRIMRFHVDMPHIVLDEVIDPAKDDNHLGSLALTPDGKYLAQLTASVKKKENAIVFYHVHDLQKPAFVFNGSFSCMAFDQTGNLYTVLRDQKTLAVYRPPLEKMPEPTKMLWLHDSGTIELLPHPSGVGFLALVEDRKVGFARQVFFVDTPK